MSRLDSFIRRLQAQRACLDLAVDLVRDLPGPIFELGLGNGRTFDHLRELCPSREIYVFERKVQAHPDCVPPDDFLVLGAIETNLPVLAARFENRVALVHSDIGSGDVAASAAMGRWIADWLPRLLVPGGIALSDQEAAFPGAEVLPPPTGVQPGRYYFYRKG